MNLTPEEVKDLIEQNECLIMFDGLSELGAYREEGLRSLQLFVASHSRDRFVFTCRTCEYRNDLEMDTAVEIYPISAKETLTYCVSKLGEHDGEELYRRIVADDQLSQLASSPLYLEMVVEISERGSLPQSRGQLLQEFVTRLLWREAARHDILPEMRKRALARLGLEMQIARKTRYPEEGVQTCLVGFLQEWNETTSWRDLLRALRADDLLREEDSMWFYRHAAFQQYFAAVGVQGNLDPLLQSLEDEWWQPVVLFLVGIVQDPNDLIATISEVDPLLACQAFNACDREKVTAHTKQTLARQVLAESQPIVIDEMSYEAFDALVGIGKHAAQPLVSACAEDETDTLLNLAAEILTEMNESVLEILTEILEASSEPMRRSAAYLLGEVGDDKAVPYLIEALRSASPETTAEAIRALGKLGDERAIEPLKELIGIDNRLTWEGTSLRRLAEQAIRQIETRQEMLSSRVINSPDV